MTLSRGGMDIFWNHTIDQGLVTMQCCVTCDQALFSFRSVKHSGGRAKRKMEPDRRLHNTAKDTSPSAVRFVS